MVIVPGKREDLNGGRLLFIHSRKMLVRSNTNLLVLLIHIGISQKALHIKEVSTIMSAFSN